MISVVKTAAYICQRYLQEFGEQIDEMKLHKLLYFMQRECLVQKGEPLFPEQLHAWKYGPVMPQIRQLYKEGLLTELPSQQEVTAYQPVFDEVFRRLAGSSSMTLVSISHGELSWKRARIGYGKYDSSDVPMSIDDIREDAERFKVRKFMLKKFEWLSGRSCALAKASLKLTSNGCPSVEVPSLKTLRRNLTTISLVLVRHSLA